MLAIQGQRKNLRIVLGFLHKITPTETISSQTPEDGAGIFNHQNKINFHCHILKKSSGAINDHLDSQTSWLFQPTKPFIWCWISHHSSAS